MHALPQKDIERFWSKVDKERSQTFYNGSRCWEWTAGLFFQGYGMIRIDHKTYRTHRISYELSLGEIPIGLQVLHHCDNRSCCNPSHLFLGTDKDNAMDRASKGRNGNIKGEAHGRCKLSDLQIAEIRRRYRYNGINGETIVELAKEFGVHSSHIYRIANYINRK